MGEVKEFKPKLKSKEVIKVLTHEECDGQLWYVEENPSGIDAPCLHRCFKCNMVVDVYGLFYSDEDE